MSKTTDLKEFTRTKQLREMFKRVVADINPVVAGIYGFNLQVVTMPNLKQMPNTIDFCMTLIMEKEAASRGLSNTEKRYLKEAKAILKDFAALLDAYSNGVGEYFERLYEAMKVERQTEVVCLP